MPTEEYNNLLDQEKGGENQGEAKKPALQKSKSVDQSGFSRANNFIKDIGDPQCDTWWKKALACFLKYLMKPLIVIIMLLVWIGRKLYTVYKILPMNVVYMLFGLALCFFGGVFFATIAAAEAFRSFGGQALLEELTVIWEEAQLASKASEEDDKVDADNDGVADVKQMSLNQLISHKARVAMAAVEDPQRLTKAMQFLFSAWLSVIATLKMQFAQTVALALGIASMLEHPATRLLGPLLAMAMGKDLHKWIPAIIGTIIKVIAVLCASFIQSIISGFYSALRGGTMFATALISMLGEAGLMDRCPDCIAKKPFVANESYLDELIGWPLAGFGFWWQLQHWMQCPSPWNFFLFPLTCIEYVLQWQIFT